MIEYSASNIVIKQSAQREALARTDAHAGRDHAVLDLFLPD